MALSGFRDADRVNFFQHSHANTRLGIGGVSATVARLQMAAGLARDKRLLDWPP
jgi:hypothetical protein